jgi:hypothetical protein
LREPPSYFRGIHTLREPPSYFRGIHTTLSSICVLYTRIHVYIHTCMHAHRHRCQPLTCLVEPYTSARIAPSSEQNTYIHTQMNIHACIIYIYTYICTCIYIYIYMHMYAHIHTHTCTLSHILR